MVKGQRHSDRYYESEKNACRLKLYWLVEANNHRAVILVSFNPSVNVYKWPILLAGLNPLLSISLSVLPVGRYTTLGVCHSPCSVHRGERERRPSGLGHTVPATTRDAARTPFQTRITVQVGRNNDSAYGNVSLSTYSGSLSFRTPPSPPPTPLSGSHSFFTPLEIVLLT